MERPRKPDLLGPPPPRGEGLFAWLGWIVTAPVVVFGGLVAYLFYLIHLAFVLVVNRVVPRSIRGPLGAWWSKYAAALIAGAFVLGVAYLIYADATDDPCGEEWRKYQAFNIVLDVPKYFTDADGSPDTWFRIMDGIEARYPDLWREREWAWDSLGWCERINEPDPGEGR